MIEIEENFYSIFLDSTAARAAEKEKIVRICLRNSSSFFCLHLLQQPKEENRKGAHMKRDKGTMKKGESN